MSVASDQIHAMVQKSKWLLGAALAEPASQAARSAVDARLQLVRHYLDKADAHTTHPEVVHQLRVATRRAAATLAGYQAFLPDKSRRRMLKRLKQVRRAANDARDYDVLSERLQARVEQTDDPAWHELLKRVLDLREDSQHPIHQIRLRLKKRNFTRKVDRLVKRVRWRGDESVAEPMFGPFAREQLIVLAEPFFAAAEGTFQDIEALHAFRIHGKHLRYAIEVFAGGVQGALRQDVYPLVAQLQQLLGDINDHAQAITRFEHWQSEWNEPTLSEPLQTLIAEKRQSLVAAEEQFHRWWSADRAADLRRRFHAALDPQSAGQVA